MDDAWYQPEEFASQEEMSHSCGTLSAFQTDWNETVMGKPRAASPLGDDCLVRHSSCPLFKPNSYIRTTATDLGVTRHLQSVPLPKAATSNYSPGFSLLSLQLAYWWQVTVTWWHCQGSGSDPNNPSNACSGGRDEPVPGVDLTSFPVQKAKQTQSEWLSLSSSQCSPSNCRDLEEHPVRENIKHHV